MLLERKSILGLVLLAFLFGLPFSHAQESEVIMASSQKRIKTNTNKETKIATIPKRLSRKYRRDAARLALRMEANNEDLRYLNIGIPQKGINNIYDLLTTIYANHATAQSIARCNVHTFPNPSIDHLIIIFDRQVDWASPLRDGISETDSDAFNKLLDDHDLIIDKHVQWDDTKDAVTIRSKSPLNMAALANEFYNIDGISEIDLGIPKLLGNDIEVKRSVNGWIVEYILRFGTIGGKGKTHFWRFEVMDDGKQVQMVEEGGAPIPSYMRCHFDGSNGLVFKG